MNSEKEWQLASYSDGTYAVACAILALARSIDRLGNADAATPMGAIEGLGAHLGEKIGELTAAIHGTGETK